MDAAGGIWGTLSRTMFEPSVRQEVHVVREVLEGAVAPALATELMFDALQRAGSIPASAEEVRAFCKGPLQEGLAAKLGDDVTAIVIERLEQVLDTGDRAGTDIPIDIDLDEATETTVMATVWREPVSVLVLAGTDDFGASLYAALGASRVSVKTVRREDELRKAIFAAAPLLVLVDATMPPDLPRGVIATSFRGLPDSVLPVVWGSETEYGEGLASALQAAGVTAAIDLRFSEGIPPLLDLVLARYQE